MSADGRNVTIVIALLTRDDAIVMVEQRHEGVPIWLMPGGMVEAGELIHEALRREVAEEAGVRLTALGRVVAVSQLDRPAARTRVTFYLIEVVGWEGSLVPDDPDGEVVSAALVPLADASARLGSTWAAIREPLFAYLLGDAPTGSLWLFRETDGQQALVARLPFNAKAYSHPT